MQTKKCTKCSRVFNIFASGKRFRPNGTSRGYVYKYENNKSCPSAKHCYECFKEHRRSLNYKDYVRKRSKTKRGFLLNLYTQMKRRVEGKCSKRHRKYYEGKKILNKIEFMEWSINSQEFNDLFDKYEASGYKRKFAPSVDRLNSKIGYVLSNIEWVTQSENSRRASINRLN